MNQVITEEFYYYQFGKGIFGDPFWQAKRLAGISWGAINFSSRIF
jgi:hypothetical protein